MHQFYIEDIENIQLSKEQKHQIKNVLRMKQKTQIRLVDQKGQGRVVALVDEMLNEFEIIEPIQFPKKEASLKIIASLIRNERLEWMIQKAAETGVDELVLYQADHGVVKSYGSKETRKLERFQTIALEASEQAMRQVPLKVTKIITKDEIEAELYKPSFYADTVFATHLYDALKPKQDLCVLTGPEGGFSQDERDLFASLGIKPVSLGDNILRAETAPLSIAITFTTKNRRGK